MPTPFARPADLIARLQLSPHPEGGHYAEVHRAAAQVNVLDGRGLRSALTSIYFLLCEGEISRWHRVASDEVWVHLEGAPIELHLLDGATRTVKTITLGPVSERSAPQHTVPAGWWQAARTSNVGGTGTDTYSLAACMVGPGFDFADFALMAEDDPLRTWLAERQPALARFC
jgi:uncharacterized protein